MNRSSANKENKERERNISKECSDFHPAKLKNKTVSLLPTNLMASQNKVEHKKLDPKKCTMSSFQPKTMRHAKALQYLYRGEKD